MEIIISHVSYKDCIACILHEQWKGQIPSYTVRNNKAHLSMLGLNLSQTKILISLILLCVTKEQFHWVFFLS